MDIKEFKASLLSTFFHKAASPHFITRYFHNLTFIQGFTEYLQCHIDLQLNTCFINFDLVKFREN